MWIRMQTTAAGSRLPFPLLAGHVYDVDEKLAREMIKARAGEECAAPPQPDAKKAREEYDETAAENKGKGEGETAVVGDPGGKPSLMDRLTTQAAAPAPVSDDEEDKGKKKAAKK